jgi:hypothetical protein
MIQVSREFLQFLRVNDKMVCLDLATTLSVAIFCNSPFTNHPIIGPTDSTAHTRFYLRSNRRGEACDGRKPASANQRLTGESDVKTVNIKRYG